MLARSQPFPQGMIAVVDIGEVHEVRSGYLHAVAIACAAIVEEYRLAMAAEDYHASLKRETETALAREGMGRGDISRRVFEEFYSTRAERSRRP
jgi:hypothetical protein